MKDVMLTADTEYTRYLAKNFQLFDGDSLTKITNYMINAM